MILKEVERTYVKALKPELKKAIVDGEPDRAASFAKTLAKIYRTAQGRTQTNQEAAIE